MRILRVSQKVYPDVVGGAPYHVHALSRDQAENGHDVTVATVRVDGSLPAIEKRDGFTLLRFDAIASPMGNDISPALGRYLAGAEEYDVIHAHSHLYTSTNMAALKRQLDTIPLAITNHGLYSQSTPEWLFRGYLKSLGRWTFNRADVVFCYTEEDRERLRSFGVSSPIAVVPNGIDVRRFRSDGNTPTVDATGAVVLFVGRLVEGKRPDLLIDMLPRIREEAPGAQLLICGDGPLRNELAEHAAREGVRDAITFLGEVPYEDMPAVYRAADVFVLPSRAEGVPRTVLEASAAGIPVVTTALPQLEGVVGETDRLVRNGDPRGFERAVMEVLQTGPTAESTDVFQWQETVDRTTAILEELVLARN